MAVFSIIQKSQLEGAHRLDAEYYQPEYLKFAKDLLKIEGMPLGEVAFITDGQHGYHTVDPSSDIRHITAKNVVFWIVDDTEVDRLSKETNDKNQRSMLEENDLLISTAGTVGEVGLVTEKILPANIDQDVARIHILDQGKLNPLFVVAFLNSKYGQFQIARQTTGQIQTHISLDKLKHEIFIPRPNWQKVVVRIVKEALSSFGMSVESYSQAEQLLLKELNLQNFSADEQLYAVVNFSDVQSAERIDAEFFNGECEAVMKRMTEHDVMKLGDIAILKKGIEPGSEAYQDEGKLFIRVSNLSKEGLKNNNQQYITEKLFEEYKEECQPQVGEILLSKDATPGVAFVVKDPIESVISGGIVRLKLHENIEPEYVALCINSLVGQSQVERDAGGSIIKHWKPGQIKNLVIPMLPITTQQKIADLVRQSHAARKKAKELLDEAKRRVEEMIEKESGD